MYPPQEKLDELVLRAWPSSYGIAAGILPAIFCLALLPGCVRPQPPSKPSPPPIQQIAPGSEQRIPHANPADYPRSLKDYEFRGMGKMDRGYRPLAWLIKDPPGFTRVPVEDRSWGQWLRHIPMLPPGAEVRDLNGTRTIVPADSPHLAGVTEIPVVENQECADAIMRLWAEYLRWAKRPEEIGFPAGGTTLSWSKWREGYRVQPEGERLRMVKRARPDEARHTFDRYLWSVFAWCGTYSLEQVSKPACFENLRIGDFFVHAGSPGHAVLIADLATEETGRKKALLLQGYMPAQNPHVMSPGEGGPWFDLAPDKPIDTPFWGAFSWDELRRFE